MDANVLHDNLDSAPETEHQRSSFQPCPNSDETTPNFVIPVDYVYAFRQVLVRTVLAPLVRSGDLGKYVSRNFVFVCNLDRTLTPIINPPDPHLQRTDQSTPLDSSQMPSPT